MLNTTNPRLSESEWYLCRFKPGGNNHSHATLLAYKDHEFSEYLTGLATRFGAWMASDDGKRSVEGRRREFERTCAERGLQDANLVVYSASIPDRFSGTFTSRMPRPLRSIQSCAGIPTKRSSAGSNKRRRAVEAAPDRMKLRRQYWLMLTGTEASAQLQDANLFKKSPDKLLIDAAAVRMHFCDGPRLAAASSWAAVSALRRTLPRVAWLRSQGKQGCALL